MKVLILCAGRGSRLGESTNYFPKAMVTINHKPVLGHILDHLYESCSFKVDPEICIAIGYRGEVIQDYVSSFYSDHDISFVKVDKFEGKSTGPGYSLLQMKDFVGDEPFMLILGDTLCPEDLANIVSEDNSICLSEVKDSSRFTTCRLDENGCIIEFFDKVVDAPSKSAIIGIYYIKDSQLYFEGLEKTRDFLIDNELQISNGLNYLLKNGKKIKALHTTWKDTGIEETLMSTRALLGDFNLSDSNSELNIIQSGRGRKYISEASYKTYNRYYNVIRKISPDLFFKGKIVRHGRHHICLDFNSFENFVPLSSFINESFGLLESETVLFKVLKQMKDKLYSITRIKVNEVDLENEYIYKLIHGFNADSILKEYVSGTSFLLNGVEMPHPVRFLSELEIPSLNLQYNVPIHGNLCLDNIFYDLNTESVHLINSKMWFGESFIYGDFSYDLASLMKSLGGLYNQIRLNNFTLAIDEDNNFVFDVKNDLFSNLLKEKYYELLMNLYGDDALINRVNLLESILFFKNAIGVNDPREKLAYFFVGSHLLNKVANCEFIAK